MNARRVLACAALAALAVAFPSSASADGDPASDVLLTQDTFTRYPPFDPAAEAALKKSVARVFARGFRIKVAVIAGRADLGSVPSLFGKPVAYARFLGTEIAPVYIGPLLIAMPQGFAIYDGGRSIRAEARVLKALKPDRSSPSALVVSTRRAVDRLLVAGSLRSKDILPPAVYPRVVFAKPGDTVSLSFFIVEDSERASDVVTVFSGTDQLAVFKSPLRTASNGNPRSVQWQVPDPAPPDLRYCVRATDRSGNRSSNECLPIKIS